MQYVNEANPEMYPYAPSENARKLPVIFNECARDLFVMAWITVRHSFDATTAVWPSSHQALRLQAAVDLIRHGLIRERGPLAAGLADVVRDGKRARLELVGAEEHLGEEAGGGVPGDVAVQRPDARVLGGVELHHDVAAARHHLDVAAHRVPRVERRRVRFRVVARPGCQHVHVQAVGVDRMGTGVRHR